MKKLQLILLSLSALMVTIRADVIFNEETDAINILSKALLVVNNVGEDGKLDPKYHEYLKDTKIMKVVDSVAPDLFKKGAKIRKKKK